MDSKAAVNSMLILRIFTLAAAAATIPILVTNKITFEDGSEKTFDDVIAYRYLLAVAAMTAAYMLVQLPFAFYHAVKGKRLIRDGYLAEFDFYGDKIISLLLASGVGVGFGVSCEFKRFFNLLLDELGIPSSNPTRDTIDKYFDRGNIATGVLAVAFLCLVVVSVLSSVNRSKSRGFFGK